LNSEKLHLNREKYWACVLTTALSIAAF
jgi:hypothetical protein